jgi:hypothetical protein
MSRCDAAETMKMAARGLGKLAVCPGSFNVIFRETRQTASLPYHFLRSDYVLSGMWASSQR